MCEYDEILREGLGRNDVELSPNQRSVVESIVKGNSVLYIDRTGAGKSETYFVAAKYLRRNDASAGPIIVISPLVALLLEQVRRAKAFGLSAEEFYGKASGCSRSQRDNVESLLAKNKLDILFITPEMLDEISQDNQHRPNPYVPQLLRGGTTLKKARPRDQDLPWQYVPLLVIDEIHCIAEHGTDFRLTYSQVWGKFSDHEWFTDGRMRWLGLTATINKRIWYGLHSYLPAILDWIQVKGSLYRENIDLRMIPKPANDEERLQYVIKLHEEDKECFILVFCQSINNVKEWSEKLNARGIETGHYYSLNSCKSLKEKREIMLHEKKFREGVVKVLLSTCALGLGYDKADIHHVVHLWTPNSLVQYYQEFGRAGRTSARTAATAHMLPTNPWNPTGWVPALSDLVYFLKKHSENHTASEQDIKCRVEQLTARRKFKTADYEDAIRLGIEKHILKQENGQMHLLDADASKIDVLYREHMEEELNVFKALLYPSTSECLWNPMLQHFWGDHRAKISCDRCSGCKPGKDISASQASAGKQAYKLTTKQSLTEVFALMKHGDTSTRFDENDLRSLFFQHRPSMVATPPGKWTICVIPDSDEENINDAATYSDFLHGMDVNCDLITKNPEEDRKVTGASLSQRRVIIPNKFIFNWKELPNTGNILLFDDAVSSGDTIDFVVNKIKKKASSGLEIVALVREVWIDKEDSLNVTEINL